MGKDKPIIVWMNGKKTRINRKDNSAEHQTDNKLYKKYAAAAYEDSDDTDQIPALVRRHDSGNGQYFQNKRRFGSFKPLIIAIFSALLIGTVMGIFMLNMFVDIDNSLAQQNNGLSMSASDTEDDSNEKEDKNTTGTVGEVESISAFVLQAGVFGGEENAREIVDSFNQAGFSAMIWPKDSQYYVFAGIANSESEAEQLAKEFTAQDLEVYVKGWSTDTFQINMGKSNANWLQQFQKQWNSSVDTLSTKKGLQKSDWEDLIAASPEKETAVLGFAKQVDNELTSLSGDYWEENVVMLRLWKGLVSLAEK